MTFNYNKFWFGKIVYICMHVEAKMSKQMVAKEFNSVKVHARTRKCVNLNICSALAQAQAHHRVSRHN